SRRRRTSIPPASPRRCRAGRRSRAIRAAGRKETCRSPLRKVIASEAKQSPPRRIRKRKGLLRFARNDIPAMISLAANIQDDSMIKPSRVGHATFETPDLDKALAYYTEVNGMVLHAREKDRAYLASKTGLLTLALERGGQENLKRISFEMAPTADF